MAVRLRSLLSMRLSTRCVERTLVPNKFKNIACHHQNLLQQIQRKSFSSLPIKPTSYEVVLPADVAPQISPDDIPAHVKLPPYARFVMRK